MFVNWRMSLLMVIASSVLFAGCLSAQSQTSVPANLPDHVAVSTDLYEQLRSRIFALEQRRPVDEVFLLSVLIHPIGEPESQIVISQRRGATAAVEVVQSKERLEDVLVNRGGNGGDADVLAKQIHLSYTTCLQVPSTRTFAWQREFLSAFSNAAQDLSRKARTFYESGSVEVTLDADSYDVHYEQGLTVLSTHFSDPGALMDWGHQFEQGGPSDRRRQVTFRSAVNRYYSNIGGRFMTPDSHIRAVAAPNHPQSWNVNVQPTQGLCGAVGGPTSWG